MRDEMRFRLHAQMPEYKRRKEKAQALIADGLTKCAAPYVACSFGKDSAVLLHLVLRHLPDVSVRFIRWQESDIIDNYADTIDAWRQRFPINLSILDLRRDSLDDSVSDRWQQLQSVAPADGYFIGLRAEESKGRRMTLRTMGAICQLKSGLWRIAPLAWWSTDDVAAYTIEHELPVLDTYHADGFGARTTSRVPRADYGIRENMLTRLKQRDMGRWNQLVAMMPEVTQYT